MKYAVFRAKDGRWKSGIVLGNGIIEFLNVSYESREEALEDVKRLAKPSDEIVVVGETHTQTRLCRRIRSSRCNC